MTGLHVALYGEVDTNTIDGSSIWLVSLAEALARQGIRISVLLRTAPERDTLLAPLSAFPTIHLIDPVARGWAERGPNGSLDARQARRALRHLAATDPYAVAIVRGTRTADKVAKDSALRHRLWPYLTDIPQPGEPRSLRRHLRARRIAAQAPVLLCQTPELAEHFIRLAPQARGKTRLLTPMVPDEAVVSSPRAAPAPDEALRLVYLGKFAKLWNTLEMTALPEALGRQNVTAELVMVGDRFQRNKDDRFEPHMRAALKTAQRLDWRQGLPRSDAMAVAATCHVGLGWRDPAMDLSLELSTKLLEYSALGLPVVCNPTPMHQRLLGADYPLFATVLEDVVACLAHLDPNTYALAAQRCWSLAQNHTFSSVGALLARHLREGTG